MTSEAKSVIADADLDAFQARGHPVHTRLLEVEVFAAGPNAATARGTIVDLRKFGFVPTGGDLQTAGVIHNMSLEMEIELPERRLIRVEPSQAVVPFEAGPRTGGESCRDSIHRLRTLAGERLGDGFSARLSDVYGGPLGCSHLLSLAHLMATTLPRALDLEAEARAERPLEREPGERLFKRSVVLDGLEREADSVMDVALQLGDVASVPFAVVDQPLDRFARQHEVRVLAGLDTRDMSITSMIVRERERLGRPLRPGGFRDRDADVAGLVGGPAVYGLARRIAETLGDAPENAVLRDTLRCFAPGVIQCMAAFAHRVVEGDLTAPPEDREAPAILQLGGMSDSCYIWREGGPGIRNRTMTGGSDS